MWLHVIYECQRNYRSCDTRCGEKNRSLIVTVCTVPGCQPETGMQHHQKRDRSRLFDALDRRELYRFVRDLMLGTGATCKGNVGGDIMNYST
jgi:hypothetical protein